MRGGATWDHTTFSPAARLLRSLRVALLTRATLRWCVEHAGDGDPLPAAWAACENPSTLRLTIDAVFGYAAHGVALDAADADVERTPAGLDAIRATCPPLTLALVLAATRRAA